MRIIIKEKRMLKVAHDVSDESLAAHARYRHNKLKEKIYAAESECDVRQAFLSLYDLDLVGNLEKYRIDYVHPAIWLEMKYRVDIRDLDTRCRVVAQIIHYLHQAPADRKETKLPKTFGIMDKAFIMLYDTASFGKYFLNPDYFKDAKSPSSPHPDLERDLARDPLIKAKPLHIIAEYDRVWGEFLRRGAYGNTNR